MITLRPEDQEISVAETRRLIAEGIRRILIQAPCGFGKCLAPETPVMMFDGSIKTARDVCVGDRLMGPDSKPRTVVSLARGREMMYRITPKRFGDSYVVNESHILSLKLGKAHGRFTLPDGGKASSGEVVNLSVKEYLSAGKTFRAYAKGWKVPVNFKRRQAPTIPAYVMGAWLGDGTSRHASITTADTEIADEFVKFGQKHGLKARVEQNSEWSVTVHMTTGRKGTVHNGFLAALQEYDLIRNKHVPDDFKLGSRSVRLELLAGIIDTDGYYNKVGYDVVQKSKRLADDVAFVARSLGFSVSVSHIRKTCCNNGKTGDYYNVSISGPVSDIPCRLQRKQSAVRAINKDHLTSAITVDPIGVGDYCGFELSGPDRLFLLGDFTVTHNTVVGAYIAMKAAEKGRSVLFLVHREELAMQASRTFTAFGVKHGLIMSGATYDPRQRVYVGMIDTVRPRVKSGKLDRKFDIVLADECHHAVSPTWRMVLDYYAERGAVILGLSATPERLSGEPLGDMFDSMVLGPPVADLIERKSLSDFVYYAPPSMVDMSGVKEKFGDFAKKDLELATDRPQITGDCIAHYKKLMPGKRAIVFAVSIEHSKHIAAEFNAAGVPAAHVDGETPRAERMGVIKAFERGDLLILSNVSLFGEGFDVKACEGVILLRATASLALHIQMTMRSMRPHESKERACIIDHVGNVMRHGLPDAEHEWSLEGRQKRKGKKKAAEDDIQIKQCPVCYVAHLPAPACPKCGHVYEVKARQLEQVDGDLADVTEQMRLAEEERRRARMKEQGRAQSVAELMALGHNKYAAERIIQSRAEKQSLISQITADLTNWQESTGEMPFPVFGVSYRDIRYMKPKELKNLRERFEAHKAEYLAARSGEFELESV